MVNYLKSLWAWLTTTPDPNHGIPSRRPLNTSPIREFEVAEMYNGMYYPCYRGVRLLRTDDGKIKPKSATEAEHGTLLEADTLMGAQDLLLDFRRYHLQPSLPKIKRIHEYRITDTPNG